MEGGTIFLIWWKCVETRTMGLSLSSCNQNAKTAANKASPSDWK